MHASISFSEAVDIAYEMLLEIERLPSEAEKLAALIVHYCAQRDSRSLSSVIDSATDQALSYDALSLAAASLIARDVKLFGPVKEWTRQTLAGLNSRPPVPRRFAAGWPGNQEHRDLLIYDIVVELRNHGIQPTRNTTAAKVSGCDAVADAMILHRQRPCSYSGVRDCFYNLKNRFEGGGNPRLPVSIINRLILEMQG